MIRNLTIGFVLFANMLLGQANWDSTYYVKYNSRLIVALFQSFRQYDVELGQKIIQDSLKRSGVNYVAEANHISGIEINYDKINFSFGYKSAPPKNAAKTGNTDHFNIGMNVGGNKWILETAYRRYYGFYDRKTSNYDSTFFKTGIYNQYPHLSSTSYKMKFLYFANAKRFSFKSGYSCVYRQIKSSASLIITANGYYNTFNTDSVLIPSALSSYYDNHADLKGIDVAAFSLYGGASINIVLWRALFLNLTLLIGPEEQWRTYKYASGAYNRTLLYQSWSGDFRMAYGLNFKRWFLTFNFASDFSIYESGSTRMVSKYLSYSGSLGFRFRMKTPKIYQRFQQTKLYKLM